ncbi:MAG: hypothetical protein E7109_02200 [Bacteroidales bacterium]|nr:hypothetical protein [Bacteroidales bacterium]
MRTNAFIKALAFATLLATACNKSEIANEENTAKKGFALPVTVNVTREGDDATKATYNESTKKLSFSAGDKLFVEGSDYGKVGRFAGLLDYDASKGKFSGTIYTQNEYSGTADALFTAGFVYATLLPAGYGSYGYLYIETHDVYNDVAARNNTYTCATSKAAGVEQFSYEKAEVYDEGFALAPQNAILNFTITGLAASTNVNVSLTSSMAYNITRTVTTDAEGKATFAAGVRGGQNLQDFSLTVAGNPVTITSSSKTLEAGKIYNITRAVTPPTLAQTMTTAGMTVKVNYNHNNDENYCLFSSNGDGTYTFQSGDGYAGGDEDCAKALVVEDGKLVFKQNLFDTIEFNWSSHGFSATFDTSNNSYKQFVGPSAQEYHNPSFISVEVNSVPIALTQIITVSDLVKEQGQSWSTIIANNSDKIKADGDDVVRISDDAKLLYKAFGDYWNNVRTDDSYQLGTSYKFEGD